MSASHNVNSYLIWNTFAVYAAKVSSTAKKLIGFQSVWKTLYIQIYMNK